MKNADFITTLEIDYFFTSIIHILSELCINEIASLVKNTEWEHFYYYTISIIEILHDLSSNRRKPDRFLSIMD